MTLDLSKDEALVLFDLLSRWDSSQQMNIADEAEQRVLWNLHAGLERQLAEPFATEYEALIAAARQRIREGA